jgi:hypothetical protein
VGTKVPMAHEGNVSEKSMMEMQWVRKYHWPTRGLFCPTSAGTLIYIRSLETMCDCVCATVLE